MNRTYYFNYIEEKLNTLSHRLIERGKLNILDLNIHSEIFFADLLNKLLGLKLKNMNLLLPNVEAIDLIDEDNKILAQVSATCTKQKIESSLSKDILKNYPKYQFKFISIAKSAAKLRAQVFRNPNNVLFNAKEDINDIDSLLKLVLYKDIDIQKEIYEFIKKELGNDIEIVKLESNLTTIINILSSENLVEDIESPEIDVFQIENKITFNELEAARDDIDDYKIYYHKLDGIYSTFDMEGSNKSFSVLQAIRKQYKRLLNPETNSESVFYSIIDAVIDLVISSKNYVEIPYEELEVCVHILVVDAFMRCKIFKNPEGYTHVIA